ncbi:uncharacterized protein [Lepeophtheirus salmonis]|uniref:uncharacterized protein n=1 Tax=Lepeophtheirus salmonis TaxID=72036 RepID=UPI001AE56206|nr:uncharacterized protein LOC121113540 [Lepeophtheirus salmonis]XP_040563275.1 uncharacterized protein LOC121113540 [Lepeophtheirus salmonis]
MTLQWPSCSNPFLLPMITTTFWVFLTVLPTYTEASIDCFKCVSINGSNPACDDPFHNNFTSDYLQRPCWGGRKGRNGLFLASSCIKIIGSYSDGSGTLTVRGCALDSGTLTTDTEIIRMSHCGSFYFNDKYAHGCVQSCDDIDACNSSQRTKSPVHLLILLHLISSALLKFHAEPLCVF